MWWTRLALNSDPPVSTSLVLGSVPPPQLAGAEFPVNIGLLTLLLRSEAGHIFTPPLSPA